MIFTEVTESEKISPPCRKFTTEKSDSLPQPIIAQRLCSGAAFLSEPRLTMRACGGAAQVVRSTPLSSKPQSRQVGLGNDSASGAPRWGLCLAPLGFWLREEARPVGPRPPASVAPATVPMELNRVSPHGWRGGRGKQAWSMAAAVSMFLIR